MFDFDVESVKDSNNNESKTCNSQLEPMETDSIDVEADTDTEEVMEPINPLAGQHLPPEVQGKYVMYLTTILVLRAYFKKIVPLTIIMS